MHQTYRDSDLRLGQFAARQIVARFSPDADFSHRLVTQPDQQQSVASYRDYEMHHV